MTITFVSAFLDLREDRSKDKSFDTCFQLARKLFSTGISFVLFLSSSFKKEGVKLIEEFPMIRIHYIELEDLETYKWVASIPHTLPAVRTEHHDTEAFMTLMNAKIEFVHRAIQENPFHTSHFAWIDFSICHVFQNWPSTSKYLQFLGSTKLKDTLLIFPGCWNKGYDANSLFFRVSWRFCGGFFLGDKNSLLDWYTLYACEFPQALRAHGVLPWEVNMWHYMELHCGFQPQWISANHDDSIVRIPSSCLYIVASLTTIPPRIEVDCRRAIESLLHQVDHIYVSIAKEYSRFGPLLQLPDYASEEQFKEKVSFVVGPDYGPAGKYIGCLDSIPEGSLIFVCDDDQEYHSTLIERMIGHIQEMAIYQNHYSSICRETSGGSIHGYVGVLIPKGLLAHIQTFPRPDACRYVDDQWMSFYCYTHKIPIYGTGIESYTDIFSVLDNHHEKWGVHSLSGLQNRDAKIKELSSALNLTFDSERKYMVKRLLPPQFQSQEQDQTCLDP